MRSIAAVATIAILCAFSSSAQAAIIAPGPGMAGTGTGPVGMPGVNAGLAFSSVTTVTPGGSAGNIVGMTLEVYAMDFGEEFTVDFAVVDGVAAFEGTTTYEFAITLVNLLGEW